MKPTENVFTFELWRVISATMVEESRPPDRYAPNGTSLTICIFTDSSRRSRNSPTASPLARLGGAGSRSGATQ